MSEKIKFTIEKRNITSETLTVFSNSQEEAFLIAKNSPPQSAGVSNETEFFMRDYAQDVQSLHGHSPAARISASIANRDCSEET